MAVTSRDRERAQAAAAELGAGALGVELDVRDAGSMSAAVDSVYAMLDGLDVLVNNSGIEMRTINPRFMTEPQPFWEVPPAGFRDVLPRVGRRIGSCNALSECGTQHSTRSLGPGRNVSVTRSQCE